MQLNRLEWRELTKTFAAAALLAIGGNWFTAVVSPDHLVGKDWRWAVSLASLGMLLAGALLARTVVQGLVLTRTRRMVPVRPAQRPVLVLFLSNLHLNDPGRPIRADDVRPQLPGGAELGPSLEANILALAEAQRLHLRPWTWAQPLRAIHHHLRSGGPLERIIVFCSAESIGQYHAFVNYCLARYAGTELKDVAVEHCIREGASPRLVRHVWTDGEYVEIANHDRGWNFEDFNELFSGLFELLEILKEQGASDSDVTVDVTGGMKPTSIAASLVTLNRRVVNQYVCTNPRSESVGGTERLVFEVLGYDLIPVRVASE